MLDELMTQPIGQGDIFANANTIILMGRTRHDGRLGRALASSSTAAALRRGDPAVPDHRGRACDVRNEHHDRSFRTTALVTGSSQGIGAAIARLLHGAGARVVINHPDLSDGKFTRTPQALRRAESPSRAGQRDRRCRRRRATRRPSQAMMQRDRPGMGRPRHPGEQRGHPPRSLDRQDDARRVAGRDRRQSERGLPLLQVRPGGHARRRLDRLHGEPGRQAWASTARRTTRRPRRASRP